MSGESALIKIKELKTDVVEAKDIDISIGRIVEEEPWEEPLGPTPFPKITSLRNWDFKLLSRYKPFYAPFCDMCCLCTFGKCNLSRDRRGACGLDIATQQARIVLIACCMGASAHTAHARHVLEYLIEKKGRDYPIDMGEEVFLEAPITRTVCGIRPRRLGDLEVVLDYISDQIVQCLDATHFGQEGHYLDYESKALHIGMLDNLAKEVADIAEIVGFDFPRGDPDAPLIELGFGTIDITKPVIFLIGHNPMFGIAIIDYLHEAGLYDAVEVCGVCCTAIDVTRYKKAQRAKIVGSLSRQLKYVRTGVPDVIVVDEQCIRTDIVEEAEKIGAKVIACSDKKCLGLPDMTHEPVDAIVNELLNGRTGVFIEEPEKAAEVAVRVAVALAPQRKTYKLVPEKEEIIELCKKCVDCMNCVRNCPNSFPIRDAVKAAAKGDFTLFAELYEWCSGCGRCEYDCRANIPIVTVMMKAAEHKIKTEKYKIRAGRGPIRDTEIREVGAPIVLGEIPGVIALVGCANYPFGGRDVAEICDEFAKRNYIVVLTGCEAIDAGYWRDEDGLTVYEKYPGVFDAGGVVNCGSCVSNAHIAGAAIKIANIFAKRPLRANFEEIADYILNRVGACGIAWGAMSQKAASIATGFNRWGVPVIIGPHGAKYRRQYLGRQDRLEDWYVYNARTGEKVFVGPAPEHLICVAETKEEAMVLATKLCIRPNDTNKGRMIKLTHYIDLYRRFYGGLPEDLPLFVRTEADIPTTMKDEILEFLKSKGWKPFPEPTVDPTIVERLIRVKK